MDNSDDEDPNYDRVGPMSGTGYGFNHDSSVVIGEGGLEDS